VAFEVCCKWTSNAPHVQIHGNYLYITLCLCEFGLQWDLFVEIGGNRVWTSTEAARMCPVGPAVYAKIPLSSQNLNVHCCTPLCREPP